MSTHHNNYYSTHSQTYSAHSQTNPRPIPPRHSARHRQKPKPGSQSNNAVHETEIQNNNKAISGSSLSTVPTEVVVVPTSQPPPIPPIISNPPVQQSVLAVPVQAPSLQTPEPNKPISSPQISTNVVIPVTPLSTPTVPPQTETTALLFRKPPTESPPKYIYYSRPDFTPYSSLPPTLPNAYQYFIYALLGVYGVMSFVMIGLQGGYSNDLVNVPVIDTRLDDTTVDVPPVPKFVVLFTTITFLFKSRPLMVYLSAFIVLILSLVAQLLDFPGCFSNTPYARLRQRGERYWFWIGRIFVFGVTFPLLIQSLGDFEMFDLILAFLCGSLIAICLWHQETYRGIEDHFIPDFPSRVIPNHTEVQFYSKNVNKP